MWCLVSYDIIPLSLLSCDAVGDDGFANMRVMCSPIAGAADQIAQMRQRHGRLEASLRHYETQIADQAAQLSKLNRSRDFGDDDDDGEADVEAPVLEEFTIEDMRREEEEIAELERKKKALEDRVAGMEKDISGVTR